MKIYRYQKASDAYTVYRAQGEDINELCTLDGYTYISGPDELPDQPAQITVEAVALTDELRERIKAASPQCQLIYRRMQEQIRARYCSEDEIYLTRIAVGQMSGTYEMEPHEPAMIAEYQAFIEGVRAWGRSRRAELGL
jgi:hypothetical protein